MNIKRLKINGKYFLPPVPTFSLTIFETNSYNNSTLLWKRFGIKELFFTPKYKNSVDTITEKTINKDAFVNEISYPKASRGTSVFIVNCSTGDFIISFLIVTHHRLTMAKMNNLLGVTMEEKGISKLLSVDLEKAVEIKEAS